MPEKISPETVKRVSQVARLRLMENEIEKFTKDLEDMLEAFKDLERVDTKGVKPSFQPMETKNVLRKDRIEPSFSQEQALSNTKNKEKGYFKGPKVT
ncbi:MAG TPA: Asp-tRNA(Asn)/Glu-tRNA(Gln) amidotransferase subunit GatC [archaeon]|jgi:aspartyl-tRNA(Asn)/glutamyl-tRNA(Gln) amidotransferase subunit C|nr:Asp-tRNA(Asn)/Glu-tRNA(Gln) amidotransferase subunit GatC [archaeon]